MRADLLAPPLRGRLFLLAAWACPALLTVPNTRSVPDAVAGGLVALGLAGLPAFLPRSAWKVACAATALALPFTLWWCGYAALNGSGAGIEAAVAAMQTSVREATDAFSFVLGSLPFLIVAAAHLVFLIAACRAALAPGAPPPAESGKVTSLVLLASLLPLSAAALFADFGPRISQPHAFFGAATWVSPLGSAEEIAVDEIQRVNSHRRPGYRRQPALPTALITQPTLAILILGESVRADAYGLRMRNPGEIRKRLAQRIAGGGGSWLPPTCASSDGTHLSIPLLLTAKAPAPGALYAAANAPTVLGILKADGYSTAWLSNNEGGPDSQERGHDFYAGAFDADPGPIHPDHIVHLDFDTDLIPIAGRFAGPVTKPTALILHFIGSHIHYYSRYPPQYFDPEPTGLAKDQLTELRYSRSLEYGARAILDAAALLDSTAAPAFLVYTSDHGENLPGDHNGLQVHLAVRTSIEDGTVPSFVLWNQAMAATGRPALVLSKLLQAPMIAHADVARVYLALAGATPGPVSPTPRPSIWGRVAVGDEYGVVACADLKP
jgi:glucan phosphoethanolaminetransferase (alkaline phosphatase superfamily)